MNSCIRHFISLQFEFPAITSRTHSIKQTLTLTVVSNWRYMILGYDLHWLHDLEMIVRTYFLYYTLR